MEFRGSTAEGEVRDPVAAAPDGYRVGVIGRDVRRFIVGLQPTRTGNSPSVGCSMHERPYALFRCDAGSLASYGRFRGARHRCPSAIRSQYRSVRCRLGRPIVSSCYWRESAVDVSGRSSRIRSSPNSIVTRLGIPAVHLGERNGVGTTTGARANQSLPGN